MIYSQNGNRCIPTRKTDPPFSLVLLRDREVLAPASEACPGNSSDRTEDAAALASVEMEIESAASSCRDYKTYEEILEVVTNAVASLKLDRPQKQETPRRSN